MAKTKTAFFCQNCGTQYAKWAGQCSACKEWNTIVEELIQKEDSSAWKTKVNGSSKAAVPLSISEISTDKEERWDVKDQEFNRVLGRWFSARVPGLTWGRTRNRKKYPPLTDRPQIAL